MTVYDVHETVTGTCRHCHQEITLPAAPVSWWRHDHNDSPACTTVDGQQAEPIDLDRFCSDCGTEIPNLQCGGLCEDCLAAGER